MAGSERRSHDRQGDVAREPTGPQITRKQFLEYAFVKALITTVHRFGAQDVIFAWDFELFKTMNPDKPVVMEEIGTSRILAPRWHNPDEPTRLVYEAGLIDCALRNGAVGWGPWSLTTQPERIGDGWRGPCSYPGMSLYETGGQPTDSPRARIEECYRGLPHPALSTLREKFPHLKIQLLAARPASDHEGMDSPPYNRRTREW